MVDQARRQARRPRLRRDVELLRFAKERDAAGKLVLAKPGALSTAEQDTHELIVEAWAAKGSTGSSWTTRSQRER